jgi:bromodomain adjacent to zinc finger domain protein 1A
VSWLTTSTFLELFSIKLDPHRYHCRVTRIYPPASVRGLAASSPAKPSSGEEPANGVASADSNMDDLAHRIGTNLDTSSEDAARLDPPAEYLYTVQLMDEESKFEGSFMEVRNTQLRCVAFSLVPYVC